MTYPTKKLGEVLDYEQPGKYIVNSQNYSNDYKTPVLTAGKTFILGNTDEKENIFPAEKLPVIIFDDFTTAIKFVDFPFKVKSSAMKILHAKKDIADIKYLFYLMQTIELNHATHKRYWISEYSQIKIPLPPLAEQKKIVAKLEGLLGKIREVKRLRAEAAEAAQNLLPAELHRIFTQSTTPYKQHPYKLKNVRMFGKPASVKNSGEAQWEEKELGEICEKTTNIKWGDHKNNNFQYVDLTSVSRDDFSIVETKEVNSKNAPSRAKKVIKTNDVIFGTTRPTLMRVTIIPAEFNNHICSTGFAVLRAKKERVLPQFIYYFIRSEQFMNRMESVQTGASYPAVSDAKVLETKIPLPPVAEQKRIVARLDSLSAKVRELQTLQSQTAADFSNLHQSILHQAFSGAW